MAEVFREEEADLFRLAKQLELAGESELSATLCRKCAEEAAQYHGQDLLVLFYGEGVYGKIRDISDAMDFVFVSRCAAKAYDKIYAKNPMSHPSNQWAKRDKERSSPALREFFAWVAKPGRDPAAADSARFGKLCDAMADPARTFRVADRFVNKPLLEIISMLANGSAALTPKGELK